MRASGEGCKKGREGERERERKERVKIIQAWDYVSLNAIFKKFYI